MSYEDFKAEYFRLLRNLLAYAPDTVGAKIFAEKIGDLVEEYPEFEKIIDEEKA